MSGGKLTPREKAAMATQSMSNATPSPIKSVDAMVRSSSIAIGLGMTGQGGKVKELEKELAETRQALNSELEVWRESLPTKKIDPKQIRASKWANRHQDSFDTAEFVSLKEEIASQGGNVQPIKVRPILGSEPVEYEIVFGHRRHRACLELGVAVLAVVESITDQTLFVEMDRENRQRANLRPYEQGLMYARALDESLFPSLRKMSEFLGVQVGNASTAVALARLPAPVLSAFESPLDIQYRWVPALTEALKSNPDVVIARAKDIVVERGGGRSVSSQDAFSRLCGVDKNGVGKASHVVKHAGKDAFKVSVSKDKVEIELPPLTRAVLGKLEKAILESLKGEGVLQ